RLINSLKARAVGQTRLVEVTADSNNPQLAADFVNELCSAYVEQNIKARWEMSQRTSQSLAHLVEEARGKLRQSEVALQNYAATSGLMFSSDNKNVAEERLSNLQGELSKAESSRIAAQSIYEVTKKDPPNDLVPVVLNQTSLREYEAKLTELQRQRAEVATTYTPDYTKVKRLDAQVESLEAAIKAE